MSINLVAGGDGILEKASKAVDENNEAFIKDDINMKLIELEMEELETNYRMPSMKEVYEVFVRDPYYVVVGYETASVDPIVIELEDWTTLKSITVINTKYPKIQTSIELNNGEFEVYAVTGENVDFKDTTAPEVSIIRTTTNSLSFSGEDIPGANKKVTGIKQYSVGTAEGKYNWKNYTGEQTISGLNQGQTYYVYVQDGAGNISNAKVVELGKVTALNDSSVTFKYETEDGEIAVGDWTNKNVKVTAVAKEDISNWVMQISTDTKNWKDGNSSTFTENGKMYVRLRDNTNQSAEEYATANVGNIDKEGPTGTLAITPYTTAGVVMGLTANLTQMSDGNKSGVNYDSIKYALTTSSNKIGISESLYTEGTVNDGTLSGNSWALEKGKKAGTYYMHVLLKDQAGNANEIVSSTAVAVTGLKNFDYTGGAQDITLPKGNYKMECWGAQGGNINSYVGGKGAYTSGELLVEEETNFQLYVGGKGDRVDAGGYNGGGTITPGQSFFGASGGGSTDIRINSLNKNWDDVSGLRNRIMVAAGGGGANDRNGGDQGAKYGSGNGGAGGELIGECGETVDYKSTDTMTTYNEHCYGTGGSQINGGKMMVLNANDDVIGEGTNGMFGNTPDLGQSGAGNGYYSGGCSYHGGAGGGSSFISGYAGCNAIDSQGNHTNQPNHFSGKVFRNSRMIAGSKNMQAPNGSTETGHLGNGYARITCLD